MAIYLPDVLLVVICQMVIRGATPGDYPCDFLSAILGCELGDCQVESHQSLDAV